MSASSVVQNVSSDQVLYRLVYHYNLQTSFGTEKNCQRFHLKVNSESKRWGRDRPRQKLETEASTRQQKTSFRCLKARQLPWGLHHCMVELNSTSIFSSAATSNTKTNANVKLYLTSGWQAATGHTFSHRVRTAIIRVIAGINHTARHNTLLQRCLDSFHRWGLAKVHSFSCFTERSNN